MFPRSRLRLASMTDMSPDLFHQGNSTGSGLFGDCHLDGLCDGPRVEPFGGESDCQFATGDVSMDFSGLAVDSIYIFDVETFHGHLDRAWHTLEPAASLKFPWETGIWCEIFGNTDRSSHMCQALHWLDLEWCLCLTMRQLRNQLSNHVGWLANCSPGSRW